LADHEDLLLVESLIEILLHLEVGISPMWLRFACAHIDRCKMNKRMLYYHVSDFEALRTLEQQVRKLRTLLIGLVETELMMH